MILFENIHSGKNNYFHCEDSVNLNFEAHTHFGYEFITVREGEIVCNFYQKPIRLTAGQAMIILPNQVHGYATPEYSDVFIGIFSPDLVEDFFHETSGDFLENPVFDFCDEEKIDLLKNYSVNRYLAKSVLYYICGKALECSKLEKNQTADPDFTYKVLYYLQENYADDVSLKTLSERLGYSYTYLSGLFHATFRCNFAEYVGNYRLERACEQLRASDKPVARIAIDCGFHTIRNFNYAFQKKYRMTPREYRNRAAENES